MILVIDNYDSFVFNLTRYVRQMVPQRTRVVRNDRITCQEIVDLAPKAIIISPGPCTPEQSGECLAIIRTFSGTLPILGICLGHQAIVQAFGGMIVRAPEPVHGRASSVFHDSSELFNGTPSPFAAGRYHSLIAAPQNIPGCLQVTARLADQTIMAVQHTEHLVAGFQFHPESVLTEYGYQLIFNFLELAGLAPTMPELVHPRFEITPSKPKVQSA